MFTFNALSALKPEPDQKVAEAVKLIRSLLINIAESSSIFGILLSGFCAVHKLAAPAQADVPALDKEDGIGATTIGSLELNEVMKPMSFPIVLGPLLPFKSYRKFTHIVASGKPKTLPY